MAQTASSTSRQSRVSRETFEDQAAAVRRILKAVDPADRKHMECAARNLQAFGAFRSKLVALAKTEPTEEQLDEIAVEIAQLLHIPIPA